MKQRKNEPLSIHNFYLLYFKGVKFFPLEIVIHSKKLQFRCISVFQTFQLQEILILIIPLRMEIKIYISCNKISCKAILGKEESFL